MTPENAKAARQGGHANKTLRHQTYNVLGPDASTNPRPHTGFFRVSEEAMRKIATSFEEPHAIRAAMLAYITLCRKANLRNSAIFEDRLISVAQDMALPYREAQNAIRLVEEIGLVKIERRTMPGTSAKLPSIYHVQTLLPDAMTLLPDAITSGEDGLHSTSPHHSQERTQELPSVLVHRTTYNKKRGQP